MSSLFKTPSAPPAPRPVPQPDMQDQQARMARRKVMDAAKDRTGRDKTILEAGYGNYSARQLGSGNVE